MKEALFYEKGKSFVKCVLCPHNCTIKDDDVGVCRVRKNVKGKLVSLVYGKAVSTQIDPIEKKPLYHFFPGSPIFSVGTVGCNLKCSHCQNWQTSQAEPEDFEVPNFSPKELVKTAIENGCQSIAYTYNEPTVFFEYMLETAKLARKKGLKNVIVSNGFINPEPLRELCKFIDAANIDLKAFDKGFYKNVCKAKLEPVLESLSILKAKHVWLEVTTLIIPGKNDKLDDIRKTALWIKKNLGQVPLHLSRFFPQYKMQEIPPTAPNKMVNARDAAEEFLHQVYLGNIEADNNTYCKKCGKEVIKRTGYHTTVKQPGVCSCGVKVPGVWK